MNPQLLAQSFQIQGPFTIGQNASTAVNSPYLNSYNNPPAAYNQVPPSPYVNNYGPVTNSYAAYPPAANYTQSPYTTMNNWNGSQYDVYQGNNNQQYLDLNNQYGTVNNGVWQNQDIANWNQIVDVNQLQNGYNYQPAYYAADTNTRTIQDYQYSEPVVPPQPPVVQPQIVYINYSPVNVYFNVGQNMNCDGPQAPIIDCLAKPTKSCKPSTPHFAKSNAKFEAAPTSAFWGGAAPIIFPAIGAFPSMPGFPMQGPFQGPMVPPWLGK
jgi:hypothetical protein